MKQNLIKKGYSLEQVKKIINNIIIDKLGIDETLLTDNSTWESLGMDSLDAIEILMELEKEFDIEITDDDALEFSTLSDLYNYLIPLKELRKRKIIQIEKS